MSDDPDPPPDWELDDDDRYYMAARQALPEVHFYNVEAEAALLGALMIDNRLLHDVASKLKREFFWDPLHGRIYHAIQRLMERGRQANPITLRPIFHGDVDMKELGGPSYLAQLTGSGAAIIGARDFADQIVELAKMRDLFEEMAQTVQRFHKTDGDIVAATEPLQTALWDAVEQQRPNKVYSAGQMIGLVEERVERIQTAGMTIGARQKIIPELQEMLGDLEGGQYTLLAGRPSMGKTTAALTLAWAYAANGHPVCYALAESTAEMVGLKVATDISYERGFRIPFEDVKKGQLDRVQIAELAKSREMADQLPLRYADMTDDPSLQNLERIVARQMAYWVGQGRRLEVLWVDYIGLMNAGLTGKDNSDFNRVSKLSKGLVRLAKKYKIHVIALAQLNRGLEQRTNKRPMMSDLRDTGDLEQDADQIVFVYRPEFYLEKEKPEKKGDTEKAVKDYDQALIEYELDMAKFRGKIEFIVEKNRFGTRGGRWARFLGEYSAVRGLTYDGPDGGDDVEDMFSLARGRE